MGNLKKSSSGSSGVPQPSWTPVRPDSQLELSSSKSGKRSSSHCCSTSKACGNTLITIIFGLLAVLTALKSLGVIVVSIMAILTAKIYSQEHSGRLAALVVVCVTAFIVFSAALSAVVAVCNKKSRPIHVAAILLITLAMLQITITAASLTVSEKDKDILDRELTDSFRLASGQSPKYVKRWATTQLGLTCCGLIGPEDYRNPRLPPYFAPDVPISCCPAYDPDRSPLTQERQREICKAKKEYYQVGCLSMVEELFHDTSTLVIKVVVGYVILETFTAVFGFIVAKIRRKASKSNENNDQESNDRK